MAFGWSGTRRMDGEGDNSNSQENKEGLSPNKNVTVLRNSNNANVSSSFVNTNDTTPGRQTSLEEALNRSKHLFSRGDDLEQGSINGSKSGTAFATPMKIRPQLVLSMFRDIHDLTRLECITIDNVLECLRERYRCQQYYTYAGPVLLSLNSCLRLPRASLIEDVTRMNWYAINNDVNFQKENTRTSSLEQSMKSPHVYDIGYQCLRNLVNVGSHQTILISGESGAGKTTATQQLIKYLTENNSRNFGTNICSNLDKKIYFATILLESFGNAKTQANPNSSRFGRLVQLNYNKLTGQIMGAEIQTYLLEKHRVAKYDYRNERNFHIFYHILQGLNSTTISAPKVNLLSIKGFLQKDLLNDALACEEEEVHRLVNAIHAFNMTDFTEIVHLLLALMALLKLTFRPEMDTSSEEEYSSGLESPYKVEFTVSDAKIARFAADLLEITDKELIDVLIARKITAGSARHSIFRKPCENIRECEERLHALTSFIYDRLFSHVLDQLNSSLKGSRALDEKDVCALSLLDLYGFENFHVNHLEQICINYANERLQQINVSIVKSYYEQSISQDEVMIPPTELIRIENELIHRIDELHAHVFAFFDEECLLKRSSEDRDILERMRINLNGKKSKFITTSKLHERDYKFTVTHYATKVDYQLKDLVQKNKDHIPPEFQDILKSSTNAFISNLFKHELIRSRNCSGATPRSVHTLSSNKNTRGKTILTRFKQSVEELMARLKLTENKDVHFIRCIRPNLDLLPGTFSMDVVEKQLHACGIGDVVKIAGNGYPIRLNVQKFMNQFSKVLSYFCNGMLDTKLLIAIFATGKSSLKFGKSLVFMSEKCWKTFQHTETFLVIHNVRIIQKAWKSYLQKKELLRRVQNHTQIISMLPTVVHSHSLQNNGDLLVASIDEATSGEKASNKMFQMDAEGVLQPKATLIMMRKQYQDGPRPSLYFAQAGAIVSRAPVHTLPIKIYTKKTCLAFAEKPPRRLVANGIQDAYEEYGINFHPS